MKKIIIFIIALLASVSVAHAVIAYPEPVSVTQPDGTVLTIRIHGDEFLHWVTCGNSLVAMGGDGYWHYASFNEDGTVKAEGARVSANASGDGSSVTPPASVIAQAMQKRLSLTSPSTDSRASSSISVGEKRFLILLIEFSDKSFTVPASNFTDLLSGTSYSYNGATGSVKKYYNDVSFNQFNPIFDIYGPIKGVSKISGWI